MSYEREKRRAKDGTYYYVVKPKRPSSGIRGLFHKYFGPPADDEYQRHTAVSQLGDALRWFLNPGEHSRKRSDDPKGKGG